MNKLLSVTFLVAVLAGVVAAADEPRKAPSPASLTPLANAADFFPILPWDVVYDPKNPQRSAKNGLASIAECNFTVAGFVRPEDLPLCEKLGLRAILASTQNWKAHRPPDEEIDQRVRQMVEPTAGNRTVLGYYIMDEPGVTWFPTLGKIVAAVKKYAPGKLAYINLYPSYATVGAPDKSQLGTASYTEYLERFVAEVKPQLLSYDNYMVQYSDDMQEPKRAANYYADLLEVRRIGQKHGLPFWNIVSSNQIRSFTTIPSPANLAFQAYTTLAAGGRGVSWFKYYQKGYAYAPVDNAGQKTETWRYLQTVNRQVKVLGPIMNRLRSTGLYFTSPPPGSLLPALPGRILKTVSSKTSPRGIKNAESPLMAGEFVDEKGADYLVIVNLSVERSANIKLETVKAYRAKRVCSSEDARLVPLDEKNGHWLPAGQGVLVCLE